MTGRCSDISVVWLMFLSFLAVEDVFVPSKTTVDHVNEIITKCLEIICGTACQMKHSF